ncbi:hypothetical protein AGDE_15336 [Angomonas deanei]|nr:hypothetical protein AGDE_15336 [Angomonas deanei]|eukprot:EPY19269.1 hypothetical protein AGDE_15336 [Angomonas deanei]
MLSTQLEAAIGLAMELGATPSQIKAAYQTAAGGDSVQLPGSLEECEAVAVASDNHALLSYLQEIHQTLGHMGGEGMQMSPGFA